MLTRKPSQKSLFQRIVSMDPFEKLIIMIKAAHVSDEAKEFLNAVLYSPKDVFEELYISLKDVDEASYKHKVSEKVNMHLTNCYGNKAYKIRKELGKVLFR